MVTTIDRPRPSGAEDMYKIYAESFRGAEPLRRILEEAQTIASDALAASPRRPGSPSGTNLTEGSWYKPSGKRRRRPRGGQHPSDSSDARERLSKQLAASGASPEAVERSKHLFDPDALTLGFARRFATYKRPDLLLHDPGRLLRVRSNPLDVVAINARLLRLKK